MVKALKLLFDTEPQNSTKATQAEIAAVRLDQPLESLAKMAKAIQAIDSSDEADFGTDSENLSVNIQWLKIDCNLC